MMPGSHNHPSALPHIPNRRQNEYPYHYSPQGHPYAPYQHQHPMYHPSHQSLAPHYPQQHWYPAYPPQPYSPAPRQFHPPPPQHHGPVIVSSHPPAMHHPATPGPLSYRPVNSTPPVAQPQTPALPTPSTPSQASQPQLSPSTPTTSVSIQTPPSTRSRPLTTSQPPPAAITQRIPFYPKLPWLSVPDQPFPPRVHRRRRPRLAQSAQTPLELPTREQAVSQVESDTNELQHQTGNGETDQAVSQDGAPLLPPSESETPITSRATSEFDSTHPTTPASIPTPSASRPTSSAAIPRSLPRPVVPIIPAIPKVSVSQNTTRPGTEADKAADDVQQSGASTDGDTPAESADVTVPVTEQVTGDTQAPPPIADKAPPKSWADLVRIKAAAAPALTAVSTNGDSASESTAPLSKAGSLPEAIRAFSVESNNKVSFLEPRGLVNTGNMCYMNSVLQSLVFCRPFYDFLDQVGKNAVHSFKSDTPLLDAMIMCMREFKIIDAAPSVEQLRLRLKENELEQYGDAFVPEFVYDVIRRLPRFSSMKRGHQQDAEEFLGFLLEGLHDECVQVLQGLPAQALENLASVSPLSEFSNSAENGWLEVGPKQKASITRSTGHVNLDSPITKIFGGNLRSEFRVPGLKPSVTLEPYQPLQLDISAPEVNNIVDALKGLTKSETLQGNFKSPRGPGTAATKQVFIESLPPVLILHLKRFHYDNAGGAQKVWKKVGYPLDLTLPKEIFAPQKRGATAIGGLPQYRLLSVVYHHGKNANGGHYTVDVRRQDGREWIRMDDTILRRIRSEDVAEGGAEEDPKILAKALEQHKRDTNNIYEQIEDGEDSQSELGGWNQVSNTSKDANVKKWSAVANGAATPSTAGKRTPRYESVKDNKVAYILFYQRMS